MNITDPQINEIYNVISKRANELSIKKVPVVFGKSDLSRMKSVVTILTIVR